MSLEAGGGIPCRPNLAATLLVIAVKSLMRVGRQRCSVARLTLSVIFVAPRAIERD